MKDTLEISSASERVGAGTERARDILESVAARAQEVVDAIDVEPENLREGLERAVASVAARDVDCTREIQAAEDRMRLKTALVTGVVASALSALVLLAAREIARRAEARRARALAEQPRSAAQVREVATDHRAGE